MSFVTMESDNDVQFEADLISNPQNPPDGGSAISSGDVISPPHMLGRISLFFAQQRAPKLKEPLAGQTEDNIAYFVDSDTTLSPNLDRSYSGVPGQVRGYNQSQAQIYLSKPILLNRWEFEAARLDPEMLIEYRSLLCKKGADRIFARSREFREFKRKYEVQLNQLRKLSRKKPKMLDPYEKGERFIVTTATEGYTLKDLPYWVVSRCFSMVDRWKIRRCGLIVPSIWDMPQQGHLVTPLWMDIFKELKAEAALFPNAEKFLCRLKFDDNTSNRLYKVRSISLAGSSNQTRCSHNVMINMPPSYDASSDPQSGRTSVLCKSREVEPLSDASSSVSIDMENMLTGARQRDPRRRPQLTDYALNPYNHGSAKVMFSGESWLTDKIHQDFNITGRQLVTGQFHGLTSQAQTSLSNSILLDPGELAVARSHPQMIIQHCSFRDKKCSKSSCGERNTISLPRCEICECRRKYEVQLGKLNLERAEVMDLHGKNERFMVTTAETGYTLTGLSPREISTCFSEADQGQIAASGLRVPSIWDLPKHGHLLKPLRKDILQELKVKVAVHPHAACVHNPTGFHGGWSNRNNASSGQASCSHNVVIDMSPSYDASSSPESRRVSFQLESRVVEPQPDASSDPETGTTPHQPETVEIEPGRNATFLERVRAFFHPGSDQEAEPLFNRARMTETILVVAAQVSLTLLTNGSSGSNSLSPNSEILKQFATICNAIGFLCCFCGILVCGRKPGHAARIITGCGYIATAYGFLAMMGMNLSDDLKLLFTAVTCIALFPVLAFALMK